MSYSDYGLDDTKKAHEDGTLHNKYWCQWCNEKVTSGLYLCFSNWCICIGCISWATELHYREHSDDWICSEKRWVNSVECFKCNDKSTIGYQNHHSIDTKLYICKSCIELGNNIINNQNSEMDKTKIMPELKEVKLASITISDTNPRKTFDEDAILELSQSIKDSGVIQPILLRPLGKDTYELVCGERRFRASCLVKDCEMVDGKIPAYIKDLSDEKALEMQITENLQRKDVHPMEEAYAFKTLMSRYDNVDEVAAKVAKKPYFIRQRLKLNELTDNWQKVYYHDKVLHADALLISTLTVEGQEKLYGNKIGNDVTDVHEIELLEFTHWDFNKYIGDLKEACFSIDDAELDASAGPCSKCNFNSMVTALFPELQEEMRCSNIPCFENKNELQLNNRIEEVINDSTIMFVSDRYYDYGNDKVISKLKKGKHQIIFSEHYSIQSPPHIPVRSTYDNDETYNAAFEKYQKKKEDFKKAVERGKFTKALMLDGNAKGRYVYITLSKKADTNKIDKGNAKETSDSVQEEIDKIKQRADRAIELDREKVHERVKESLKVNEFWTQIGPLSNTELIAGIIYIHSELGWQGDKYTKKVLGKEYDNWGNNKLYTHLCTLNDVEIQSVFNQFLRYIVFDKLCSSKDDPGKSNKAAIIRDIALQYEKEQVKIFDLEQQELAIKRIERSEQRINSLKTRKKELLAAEQQPDAAKKKSAGKGVNALLPDAPAKKAAPKKAAAKKSTANKTTKDK